MALDPLSAASLAGTVIQIIDFSSRLVSNFLTIYKSADGASTRNIELEITTKNMVTLTEHLIAKLDVKPTENEREFYRLGEECRGVASELLIVLEKLKAPQASTLKSLRLAILGVWEEEKISALQGRLDNLRQQIVFNTMVTLREQVSQKLVNESLVLDHVKNIETNTRTLGEEFLEHIGAGDRWHADFIADRTSDRRRWREDLIEATQKSDWHVYSSSETAEPFSELSVRLETGRVQFLRSKIMEDLRFMGMDDRHGFIEKAHKKTFEWIWSKTVEGGKPWANFAKWLEAGSGIYWITGKAGSGKSTLMKYIYHDPRTNESLEPWASSEQLVTAAFFFWSSGRQMQMSREGLLRSLLYQVLQKFPALVARLFPKRWEVCCLFGSYPYPWAWPELAQAFQLLAGEGNETPRFFFLVDGLDEFDGDYMGLVDVFKSAASCSHIKICISSRPWLVFEEAFKHKPSLMLQDLTYNDIKRSVADKLYDNSGFTELKEGNAQEAEKLIEDVAKKASGVFLWVTLVVRSLLAGLINGDTLSELQKRLDALPADLEEFFNRILDDLDPSYFVHASKLFQIVRSSVDPPTILCLSFADEDPGFIFRCDAKPLSEPELMVRAKMMRRRLSSRCKDLLEVGLEDSQSQTLVGERNTKDAVLMASQKVYYLHRTVKDFIEQPRVWKRLITATGESFNPYVPLCQAFVLQVKTLRRDPIPTEIEFWRLVTGCIYYATKAEANTPPEKLIPLIDELSNAAGPIVASPNYETLTSSQAAFCGEPAGLKAFWSCTHPKEIVGFTVLPLAVRCGLYWYVEAKLEAAHQIPCNAQDRSLLEYAITRNLDLSELFNDKLPWKACNPNVRMTSLLLTHGANPNQAFMGSTPWNNLCSTILREFDPIGIRTMTPLILGGRVELVGLFLKHDASVGKTYRKEVRPLLYHYCPETVGKWERELLLKRLSPWNLLKFMRS